MLLKWRSVAKVEAPTSVQEGKPLFIDASKSSDANNDPLTYKWTQLGGASFNFDPAAAKLNLVAPSVNGVGTNRVIPTDGIR